MDDEKGEPPSNVIELIRKHSEPSRPSSSLILQGLELIGIFLAVPSAEGRKQIVEFAKQLSEDANTVHDRR